jgi:hypothetical protein
MKHKHYDLILAYANGIECEYLYNITWYGVSRLEHFDLFETIRYKPIPKPDVVILARADVDGSIWVTGGQIYPNIKITFDGQTEKIKNAEVIK